MLGGYGKYHELEMAYSVRIFEQFLKDMPSFGRAFDVGAGIGRVTKVLLNKCFKEIDLLD